MGEEMQQEVKDSYKRENELKFEQTMRELASIDGLNWDKMSDEEKEEFEIQVAVKECKLVRREMYNKEQLEKLSSYCVEELSQFAYVDYIYYKVTSLHDALITFVIIVSDPMKVLSNKLAKTEWRIRDKYERWDISFNFIGKRMFIGKMKDKYELVYEKRKE